MNQVLAMAGRKWNAALRAGPFGKYWQALIGPFHRSIYVRFQYIFGLALFGLALMATITFISGSVLLDAFEDSVSDARFDMVALHEIQESLHETERLMSRYAIGGDPSAPSRFKQQQEAADRNFRQLANNELETEAQEHARFHVSLPKTIKAWQDAQDAVLKVFREPSGTPEAVDAMVQAIAALTPLHDLITEFLRFSMGDLDERLTFAKSVMHWAHLAILAAILVGLGTLLVVGLIVGRSVLQPIGGLQEAARKLGRKDFSHRVKLHNPRDELGQLGKAFNIASATLQRSFLELKRRSTHDGLTGAINRGEFEQRLIAECASADRKEQSLALMMVDVDFFKRINDNYGHQAGDRVLQATARLLSEAMRPGDLVARYGGEEFAVILPETDQESALMAAERLRTVIEMTAINCVPGTDIAVTVSIGCACRQSLAMTPGDLVQSADMALYRAKQTGRNRVVSAENPARADDIVRSNAVA